jgi:hypothetical protein
VNRARLYERVGRLRRLALAFSAALGFTVLGTGAFMVPSASALRGLTTGFANAPLLTFTSDPTRALWLSKAAGEGAGMVRIPFVWQQVAPKTRPTGFNPSDPASPGYNWSALDSAVKDITAHGLQPVLLPYLAPVWAQGPNPPGNVRPGVWKPDPTQFGHFATALATRYSGNYPDPANPGQFLPHVTYYQAWNEPNFGYDIMPQWKKVGSTYVVISGQVYRPMLNAFYSAIKAVNPLDFVAAAGTGPYGTFTPRTSDPNKWQTQPLKFWRDFFCLNKKLKKDCSSAVHLNAIDNHPYVLGGGPTAPPHYPDDVDIANEYKLWQVLTAAEHAGTVLPAGSRQQLWAGEISWPTNPPVPNHIAVTPATQAAYLEQAMYLLWRQHVSTVSWLDIRDMTQHKGYNPFFYGGLYFSSGAPKPSATAFRFPFITHRLDSKHVQAWGRAPIGGQLSIERFKNGKWITMAKLAAATHQVFEKTLTLPGAAKLRAQVGTATSVVWSQSK